MNSIKNKIVFNELSFYPNKHLYQLNDTRLPSVTTIMKPLSNALYKDIEEKVLSKAANKGTTVHNAIENYCKFGITDIENEYEGYFNAYLDWYKKVSPQIIANECKVYHRYMLYAGTADMLVIIDGKVILIDFKTTSSVNEMLTSVQLEAYSKAYESHGVNIDGKAVLHLKKDGKYSWHFYEKNDIESWEVFGALIVVHNHIKKYK